VNKNETTKMGKGGERERERERCSSRHHSTVILKSNILVVINFVHVTE